MWSSFYLLASYWNLDVESGQLLPRGPKGSEFDDQKPRKALICGIFEKQIGLEYDIPHKRIWQDCRAIFNDEQILFMTATVYILVLLLV
jgi:hypothetical protein